MTIPNLLTLARFPLAPLFLLVFLASGDGGFLRPLLSPPAAFALCLAFTAFCEISDLLDGYLARRWGQVTDLGKILDPYADSTFHLTCFFAFAAGAHGAWFPLWMVVVLFYREVAVGVIRKLGTERGIFIQARTSGKLKSLSQASAVIALLILALALSLRPSMDAETFRDTMAARALPMMWIVVGISVLSILDYAWANRALFRASAPKP